MKLKKVEAGLYKVVVEPRITIGFFFGWWDVFVDNSVHQSFGSFRTLKELKTELDKYSSEEIVKTVDFGKLR